tara:strand:- start:2837 stop:3190 length:354 start_codon:yes stop_codon:yes gene_type:complete
MSKFFFVFFFVFGVNAKDYCEIHAIFDNSVNSISCDKGQKLFGYYQFESENSQFEYEFNKKFNVYLLKLYKNETLNFLEKYCFNDDDLKIKEITNLNKSGNSKFVTKIIVSCKLKSI